MRYDIAINDINALTNYLRSLLIKRYGSESYRSGTIDFLIKYIYDSDPTNNKIYSFWITNQLRRNLIRLPEDSRKIYDTLLYFHKNKNNAAWKRLYINDINQYDIHELVSVVDKSMGVDLRSKSQRYEDIKTAGTRIAYNNGIVRIVEILTPEAAVAYSKNTKWCTSNLESAASYIEDGTLYVIFYDGKKVMQMFLNDYEDELYGDLVQVADVLDIPISKSSPVMRILDIQDAMSKFLLSIKNPYGLLWYATIIRKRWPEGEPIISQHADASYIYARDIIRGRWPEGEPNISKDATASYEYAENVIRGRWPEGEPAIIQDPHISLYYAKNVIRGRFYAGEPTISKDAASSFEYARHVIRGRWPEGEPAISKDAAESYKYAEDIIRGRWPEGEPAISRDAMASYEYASNIILGRWPEGEPAIKSDPMILERYEAKFPVNRTNPSMYYHVTHTKYVPSIIRHGLRIMGGEGSNWIKSKDKERYGSGEVYVFDNIKMAIRWAAHMDWVFNTSVGSGNISIIEIDPSGAIWQKDEGGSLLERAEGDWWKSEQPIGPKYIGRWSRVTLDITRMLAGDRDIEPEDVFAKHSRI